MLKALLLRLGRRWRSNQVTLVISGLPGGPIEKPVDLESFAEAITPAIRAELKRQLRREGRRL